MAKDLEERVAELEKDVKLLKNEIRQILVDIKGQLSEGAFSFTSLLKPRKTTVESKEEGELPTEE